VLFLQIDFASMDFIEGQIISPSEGRQPGG
jgi:hypothetical protein